VSPLAISDRQRGPIAARGWAVTSRRPRR